MIDTVYIDPKESNENAAARYPHLIKPYRGGWRWLGEGPISIQAMGDERAAYNASLRRFARGG